MFYSLFFLSRLTSFHLQVSAEPLTGFTSLWPHILEYPAFQIQLASATLFIFSFSTKSKLKWFMLLSWKKSKLKWFVLLSWNNKYDKIKSWPIILLYSKCGFYFQLTRNHLLTHFGIKEIDETETWELQEHDEMMLADIERMCGMGTEPAEGQEMPGRWGRL